MTRAGTHSTVNGTDTIYSVASHGSEYFYYILQSALLLSRRESRDVRITLLPYESIWRRFAGRAQHILRVNVFDRSSVYGRFLTEGTVTIARHGRRVTFVLVRFSRLTLLAAALRAAIGSGGQWLRSFQGLRFVSACFLESSHLGTRIGDLAAGSYFRGRGNTTELMPSPLLLYWLWKACYLLELMELLTDGLDANHSYTMAPELSYVHAAPHRYLHERGAAALDIFQTWTALAMVPSGHDLAGRFQPWHRPSQAPRTRAVDRESIEQYFHARLYDSSKVLYYMLDQNDNRTVEILDSQSKVVTLQPDGIYATVFLHSFADAQYYFGIDGFSSLAHWTFFTIERCLRNASLTAILIKPHPSADYQTYPGDRRVLRAIVRRFGNDQRLTILNSRASIVGLCRSTRFFGITHHGSVAEELVYLGQPTIASTFSPWGDRYRFAETWSTPAEYAGLLDNLSAAVWKQPGDKERNALFEYVTDYRFTEVGQDRRNPKLLLRSLRAARESGGTSSDYLARLRMDDPDFVELLDEFEKLQIAMPDDEGIS
jgi:hypothetical protein